MKSYIVDRSGLTPQLNEMPTNVEKIYPTKADAEAALANGDIADGEFVSTVDTVADTGDKFDKSYLSYSTEETLTGGTWIDGKPIYRKVVALPAAVSLSSANYTNIGISFPNDAETMFPPKSIYPWDGIMYYSSYKPITAACIATVAVPIGTNFILEYTKTGD